MIFQRLRKQFYPGSVTSISKGLVSSCFLWFALVACHWINCMSNLADGSGAGKSETMMLFLPVGILAVSQHITRVTGYWGKLILLSDAHSHDP